MSKIKDWYKEYSGQNEFEDLKARAKAEGRELKWKSYKEFMDEPLSKGSGEPTTEQTKEKEERMKRHYQDSPLPWYSATTFKEFFYGLKHFVKYKSQA